MAWTDEQRRQAIGQIPMDTYQAPKPNSFGDAAAAASGTGVAQVPTGVPVRAATPPSAGGSGPLQRSLTNQGISTAVPPVAAAPSPVPGVQPRSLAASAFNAPPSTPAPQPSVDSRVNFDPSTNSYSGGNVGGNISINDRSPNGGFAGGGNLPPSSGVPSNAPGFGGDAVSLISRAFSGKGANTASMPQAGWSGVIGSDPANGNAQRERSDLVSSLTSVIPGARGITAAQRNGLISLMGSERQDETARANNMQTNQAHLQAAGMNNDASMQRSLIQAAMDQQRNQNDLTRTGMTEAGANQRSLVGTLGTLQAAQVRADAAAKGSAPAGYRYALGGSLEAIPGGPADKSQAPLNDVQSKALQFGSRMQESSANLTRLAGQGVEQPGLMKRAADAVGLGAAANWTQSPEQQQVEQSQRDYINAILRRESGAAISDGEFDNARKQYFPQPGDSPEVIEQKLKNRDIATAGIKAEVPNADARIGQVLGAGNAAVAAPNGGGGGASIGELQRRAASDPALAARLKEMGY